MNDDPWLWPLVGVGIAAILGSALLAAYVGCELAR